MRRFCLLLAFLVPALGHAADAPRRVPLTLRPDDVLATGNEWVSLPDIRAADGALSTFNALSMRDRGLLQASGESARPVLQAYFQADGKTVPLQNLSWELLEYWIPQAHQSTDGLEFTITFRARPGPRGVQRRAQRTVTARNARSLRVGGDDRGGRRVVPCPHPHHRPRRSRSADEPQFSFYGLLCLGPHDRY